MEGGTKIADAFKECQGQFANLFAEFKDKAPSDLLYDQPGRIRLWARNIGAHQRGTRSSLDYRLRNAPHLVEAVLGCLEDIKHALLDVIADLDPSAMSDDSSDVEEEDAKDETSRPEGESSPDPQTDSTDSQPSDLAPVIKHINHLISCLFDLSVTIRNPATRRLRPVKYSSIDVSGYWPYELEHVRSKLLSRPEPEDLHQHCPSEGLIERLARGNLERRQYFIYQTQHHEKLQQEIEDNASKSQQPTTATEYIKKESIEGDYTSSSYAPSEASCVSVGDGQQKLSFPPLPREAADQPYFECPYCYELLAITTTLEWRKHLLLDLRPYMCVFDDCIQTGALFPTRKEWFNHECNFHWNHWSCCDCQQILSSLSAFEEHMRRIHLISAAEYHKRDLAKVCRRTKDQSSLVPCEICGLTTSLKNRIRHMGRHLEDIALFALGTWEQDPDEHGNDASDEEEEDNAEDQDNESVVTYVSESQAGRIFHVDEDGMDFWSGDVVINAAASEADQESGRASESTHETDEPRGRQPRLNEYFVPGEGISREVITVDIGHYLGDDALVRPGIHEGTQGYFIRAYRNLTPGMIEGIKANSARWEQEFR